MLFNSGLLATLALAGSTVAHSVMFGVSVNGKDQGDGRKVYIRSPSNNSPVKDLKSAALACGDNGAKAVPKFVAAAAGDTLTFEWFHDNRGDDIIDKSHQGPILTYIAPFSEGMDGQGPVWTKIAQDTFEGGKWAVQRLIDNKGKVDLKLDGQLEAGKYLVRQEIIAHHESDATFDQNPARGAQFYPSCVQLEVSGSGTVKPSENFDLNKGYQYSDPGIHFNLYSSDPKTYKAPGPAVFSFSGGGAGTGTGAGNGTAPAPSSGSGSGSNTCSGLGSGSDGASGNGGKNGGGNGEGKGKGKGKGSPANGCLNRRRQARALPFRA